MLRNLYLSACNYFENMYKYIYGIMEKCINLVLFILYENESWSYFFTCPKIINKGIRSQKWGSIKLLGQCFQSDWLSIGKEKGLKKNSCSAHILNHTISFSFLGLLVDWKRWSLDYRFSPNVIVFSSYIYGTNFGFKTVKPIHTSWTRSGKVFILSWLYYNLKAGTFIAAHIFFLRCPECYHKLQVQLGKACNMSSQKWNWEKTRQW